MGNLNSTIAKVKRKVNKPSISSSPTSYVSIDCDGLRMVNRESYLATYGFIRKHSTFNATSTICNICLLYYYDVPNTALFYHSDCLKHKAAREHPERPERLSSSYSMLNKYGILDKLNIIKPREATIKELLLTHEQSHINTILSTGKKTESDTKSDELLANESDTGLFDSDTFYNEYSKRAALLAAGATIDLITDILTNKYDTGFALIRPPGHHCECNKPMGFCLFNNVVVAVHNAHENKLCKKTLIVDWDVHHGNGTQNMFYDNKNVLYFSVHRHDDGTFYPTTGKIDEMGHGYNINVPLNISDKKLWFLPAKGFGDREYVEIWKHILLPICAEFEPDIIVISAGFDACIGDPLGQMNVTPPCYGLLTRLLLNKCKNIAVVLEGGYNLQTMPRAICCVNYALLIGPRQQKNNYDIMEFENEFLKYINVSDNIQSFNEWRKKCKQLLVEQEKDDLNYEKCKKQIKMVLLQQCKYWKSAQNILNDHYS